MRLIKALLILISISSCNSKNNNQKALLKTNKIDSLNLLSNKENINTDEKTEYRSDTLKIGNNFFTVIQKNPSSKNEMNLTILNSKNDTIYCHDNYATNGFEFEDFDNDGVLDIRLYQITNVGGISELIMYDNKNSTFKPIINFDNFPEPTKIKNINLWYSYHRSGCADINWGSELFKIVDFKAIKIGKIEGRGCEGETENGIFAYKINGEKETKVYSEKRESGYYSDKWDFIEKYWNKNYKQFK